jgi:p70 ribosomal S6 kinase
MRTERDVLTRVEHPYIVTLQYSFQARSGREASSANAAAKFQSLAAVCVTPQTATKLYLILDFINGGHLFFQLYRAGGPLPLRSGCCV